MVRVAILLATYNGADFLAEQLESYVAQTHESWQLYASDDGSTDETLAVLDAFRSTHAGRVTVVDGPRNGFAANFLHLLRRVDDAEFAALSDQDDVWFDTHLARGVAALKDVPQGKPALYCARTLVTDAQLNPIKPTQAFTRPPSFENALVQSLGGGNTMMLNRAARELVAQAAAEAGEIVAHDWWLYQIISACGGVVINGKEPVLCYRQHGRNAIGANQSAMAKWTRLSQLMQGRFRAWHSVNLPALKRSAHRMTPSAQATLKAFEQARTEGAFKRLKALSASGVLRQSRSGTLALYVACALGRL